MKTLMMKLKVLAAVVAGMLAFGAQAGTFLENLANDARKVDSSPYATGGDVILHSGGDYIHVFTNTDKNAALAFTPTEALNVRVLVIGGGGSGGGNTQCTGGGGAGGFVERTGIALAAETAYPVVVGAGGQKAARNGGYNGANSTFVDITAYGGGAGGGYGSNPTSGGSGGGGYWANGGNMTGAQPTDPAQGNAGANGVGGVGGGGGGGAGSPGDVARNAAGTTVYGGFHGGIGGDGRMSDILGFEQYFAGGGGGGSPGNNSNYCRGPGGIGGGGSGALAMSVGTYGLSGEPGEDGLGGGGGGKGNNTNASNTGGKGGDGIVIVRYFKWTESKPLLRNPSVSLIGGTRVVAEGAVSSHGVGALSTTLHLTLTPKAGEAKVKANVVSGSTVAGDVPFAFYVGNLLPDTEYDYELYAENDQGEVTAAVTGKLTTMADSLFATADGATITTNEYDVIVNFSTAGSYTLHVGGDGTAQMLVVGGGGSGGYGTGSSSGGGGGGVVYSEKVFLLPGDHSVVVGAGGLNTKGSTDEQLNNGHGKESSFAANTANAVVATGGGSGIGWDVNNATGASGASGGGACRNAAAGAGIFGQGYAGGSPVNNWHSCGGGGAGGVGKGSASNRAGDGGPGVYYTITGGSVCYGAGGGAGCHGNNEAAGIGGENAGNGRNSAEKTNATSGVDGTGGGGGGGGNGGANPGAGGCGCVIIRYTDYTLLPEGGTPVMSAEAVENVQAASFDVPVKMVSMGEADAVALRCEYWYDAEDATNEVAETKHVKTVAAEWAGDRQVFTVGGLAPLHTYYCRLVADGGTADLTTRGEVMSVTMLSPFAGAPALDNGILSCSIGGVPAAGEGETSFVVMFGDTAETAERRNALAGLVAGANTTPLTLDAADFGLPKTCFIRYTSTAEGKVVTADSPVWSGVVTDKNSYTWKGDVAEGYWDDAANWSVTATGAHAGYPVTGSTAKFDNLVGCVKVKLRKSVYCASYSFNSTNLTFVGEGDGITMDMSGETPGMKNGTSLTVKDMTLTLRAGGGQMIYFPKDSVVTLDGALLRTQNGGGESARSSVANFNADNTSLVLRNGAKLWCAFVYFPTKLTIEDGDSIVENAQGGLYDNTAQAAHAAEMTFNLPDCRGKTTAFMTAAQGITVGGGQAVTLNVTKSSPIRGARSQDVQLVSAVDRVDPTKFVFGTTANKGDYFYFTETDAADAVQYKAGDNMAGKTMKCIWYHHQPTGFAVILQ